MGCTSYIDGFIPEGKDSQQCLNCGICLQKCPVLEMEKDEAKAEIKRLINDEPTQRVLNECTFCFSCNHYCPSGLKPYALIMERMVARNVANAKPRPKTAEYLMHGKAETNYWYDLYNAGSPEDKSVLDRWAKVPPASKDTLFIGCYGRSVPQPLENAAVLKSLAKYGPRDACCGEIPYRFGDFENYIQTIKRTLKMLQSLETDRLVCYCASCCNGFGNLLPNYLGVKLPFQVISLYEWLWEKHNNGEFTFKRPISKDTVVSDSCYASELGDGFFDAVRGLYKAAGMNVIELENNRYDASCCGFATALRDYDLAQVSITAKKKVDEILSTKTKNVSFNCPGCYAGIQRYTSENNIDLNLYYGINTILRAIGENI